MSENDEQIKLDAVQKLILWARGRVQVDYIMKPGWKAPLPLYVFWCPRHGLVKDYAHKFRAELRCPRCAAEHERIKKEAGA